MTSVIGTHAGNDSETDDDAERERAARPLRDRIHACVPVTHQAFGKLLSLLSIEASDQVATACVTTGARSRLLVNPAFVARHCRTDEHLAMLVLHELYHVLLGHTRLYPRVTPAQNWAFDCLINAQLCRLFPDPRHTSFFAQFVDGAEGPARLLAPPGRWRADLADGGRPPTGERDALSDTHWRLYSDDSVTVEELYRLLERVGVEVVGPWTDVGGDGGANGTGGARSPLLGNHDGPDAPLHPEALREVRDIVARWPMIERRSGRDQGGEMREERVPPGIRRARTVRVLRQAIARAAGRAGRGLAHRFDASPMPTLSPFDTGRDRRAAVQRLLGAEPLFAAGEPVARQRSPVEQVRVYLDVSGSMDDVLPALYAALANCLDLVEPVVWGFSTGIGALRHAQLRAGVKLGTGGTEIGTVTAHLLASGARRALVVTDGWVGSVPDDHRAELARRRVRLVAAVTHQGDAGFAEAIGAPVLRLPA